MKALFGKIITTERVNTSLIKVYSENEFARNNIFPYITEESKPDAFEHSEISK